MRKLIILLLVFGFFKISYAQLHVNDNCKLSYEYILSLRFEEANLYLDKEKKQNPNNVYIPYLESYIGFLKSFISEDDEVFQINQDRMDKALEAIDKLENSSPYKNYLKANINLQWAFARIKFGEYFSAVIEINRAYRLIEKNSTNFPDFYPNITTHAVLKIIIGLVPDKYDWVLDLISMEGSVEEGTQELYQFLEIAEADSNYAYLKNECLFYLGFIEINLNPVKENSQNILSQIIPLSDSNLLFNYMSINILTKLGRNFEAEKQFSKINNHDDYYPFYFLDYLHADFLLKEQETDSAKKYFAIFLKNFKGKNYIKDAWRKTAWAFLLEGKPDKYKKLISVVGNSGNNDVGIDKDAQLEYEQDAVPNVALIKARLLFDGFRYNMALTELENIDDSNLNFEQLLEKKYRYGRIYHKTNKTEIAKKYYKEVVISSDLTSKYFPANSALNLGEIYELQDSLNMALMYYKKCGQMNFNQFENSIKSMAKEGARRVNNDLSEKKQN
ncbi:MAG: hypothetical protein C0598_02500 [Marinilabiliales bacterium]|nr:MAG: hypothetical protein C0598_02500 [Marinilabiliales bacterium]